MNTPKRVQTRRVKTSVARGDAMANIPLQMAYQQRQTTSNKVQRISFSDMYGTMAVSQTTPVGRLTSIPLNPILLSSTRMSKYAALYGKYRFRRIRLTVGANMPTNISGNYTVGYCENPDQDFSAGPSATNEVYALSGAINKPYWQRADCDARLADRSKWYNIDPNSSELMNTTQGKFVIVNVSPPTVMGGTPITDVQVPMYLDYDIEFSGSAIQIGAPTDFAYVWPAGVFTSTAVNGVYTFAPASGVQPALLINQAYIASPPWELIFEAETNDALLIARVGTLPDTYAFFVDEAAFVSGTRIQFGLGDVQTFYDNTTVRLKN